ncbi:hypothetical protein SARC_14687, partial [Sphaeroforma arctica JP610]
MLSNFVKLRGLSVPARSAPCVVQACRSIMTDSLSQLTEDQVALRDSVHKFAKEELAPYANEIDRTNNFDQLRPFWKKLGDMGLLGITAPEEYG